MKICYFDAFSGISGDMTVGALIDAGADASQVAGALESIGAGATFRVEKVKRRGIAATKFHVDAADQKKHRHLPHILEMIDRSAMNVRAKANAAAVFRRLGEVEAAVHGVPIEKVHFHEVGAVDSICDIAGACTALELLGVTDIYCSPVNVGSGTVNTEHGVLPVPAPATAALLTGTPVYARGPEVELTTPTGAAILATLCRGFGPAPPMRIEATGYGAGDRDFPSQANVLRALIGSAERVAEATAVTLIEANIDDSTPEVLGHAMDRLLSAGALDVTMTPLWMKKNRPGTMLSVIAPPERQEELIAVVFAETSTLGIRIQHAERRVQARQIVEVDTVYGKIRMKVASSGAFAPEYEDCRRVALERGVPLKRILAEANHAYHAHLKQTS